MARRPLRRVFLPNDLRVPSTPATGKKSTHVEARCPPAIVSSTSLIKRAERRLERDRPLPSRMMVKRGDMPRSAQWSRSASIQSPRVPSGSMARSMPSAKRLSERFIRSRRMSAARGERWAYTSVSEAREAPAAREPMAMPAARSLPRSTPAKTPAGSGTLTLTLQSGLRFALGARTTRLSASAPRATSMPF